MLVNGRCSIMKLIITLLMIGTWLTLGIRVEGACPSSTISSPCTCVDTFSGLFITCPVSSSTTPEQIQGAIGRIATYDNITNLVISGIYNNFNYVPTDLLSGNGIPNVVLSCSHTLSSLLTFSSNAFTSSVNGECTLTGNLTITDCNLRQLVGDIFTNCFLLEKLDISNSNVDEIVRFPRLDSLKNLTINSARAWSTLNGNGLKSWDISADAVPSLTYLDLRNNALQDDAVGFISQLSNVVVINLDTGNNLSKVPDLSNLSYLQSFSIYMDVFDEPELALLLPTRRRISDTLDVTVRAPYSYTGLNQLQGDLRFVNINLFLRMTYLNESVFYQPLREMIGYINLSSDPTYLCKCNLAWLLRDNRDLLGVVRNGFCSGGGQRFEDVGQDEFFCCPVDGLLNNLAGMRGQLTSKDLLISQLRQEIQQLRTVGFSNIV